MTSKLTDTICENVENVLASLPHGDDYDYDVAPCVMPTQQGLAPACILVLGGRGVIIGDGPIIWATVVDFQRLLNPVMLREHIVQGIQEIVQSRSVQLAQQNGHKP